MIQNNESSFRRRRNFYLYKLFKLINQTKQKLFKIKRCILRRHGCTQSMQSD